MYNSIPIDQDDDFSVTEIDGELFMCREKYYTRTWNLANIWVVKGSSMDLIIDTGTGVWDLHGFLKEKQLIGDKPFQAVATHIHFDHSGGIHQFKEFSIHRAEAEAIRKGDNFEACRTMTKCDVSKPPSKDWSVDDYRVIPAEPTRVLEDGDIFDLGDKQLRVLHLPGHSRGSIALYDEANRKLFTGDIIYDGPLVDFLPYSNVLQNITSLETLVNLAPHVDQVFPGHYHHFSGAKLHEIATTYLNKVDGCGHCSTLCCLEPLASCLMRGRNTDDIPAKCCFYSCCCCCCV